MPVFETHLKIYITCFLYIQQVVTRNNFTQFRSWKLETLTLPTVKENLYMNLLRTIVSSFVNKNYYVVTLFLLCFPFCLRGFCISLATLKQHWILNQNIFKKKIPKNFQHILCRMDKWNLFLSTNVLSFNVLTILIHHFVLFFSILSQKEKFYVKRRNNTRSSYMIFSRILCQMDIFFKRLSIYQNGITMNISNT